MIDPSATLFDHGLAPAVEPIPPNTSIEHSFAEFHRANPWVCEALTKLALDLHARGRKRIGMKMLFEVLRWQHALATIDEHSVFVLNNSLTSRYARLIMEQNPELAGIFETRKLTTP